MTKASVIRLARHPARPARAPTSPPPSHDEATLVAARILWFDLGPLRAREPDEPDLGPVRGHARPQRERSRSSPTASSSGPPPPTLDCAAFPHLAKDIATVTDYSCRRPARPHARLQRAVLRPARNGQDRGRQGGGRRARRRTVRGRVRRQQRRPDQGYAPARRVQLVPAAARRSSATPS